MCTPIRYFKSSIAIFLFVVFFGDFIPISVTSAAELAPQPIILLGDNNFPPFKYKKLGEPEGLAVDLVRAIATAAEIDLDIQLMQWSIAQERVLAGKAHGLVLMVPTPARRQLYDFSKTTGGLDFTLFVDRQRLGEISLDNLSNKRIATTRKGLPFQLLPKKYPGITVIQTESNLASFGKLLRGEVDAVATGRLVGLYLLKKHGVENVAPIAENFAETKYAIALAKGNRVVLDKLNMAIERLDKNGTLDEISDRWLSQNLFTGKEFWLRREVLLMAGAGIAIAAVVLLVIGRIRRSHKIRPVAT